MYNRYISRLLLLINNRLLRIIFCIYPFLNNNIIIELYFNSDFLLSKYIN